MKSLKYIALGVVALSLGACADFFETESPSAVDSSVIFSSTTKTGQAIEGIYDQFGADKSYRNRLACGFQGMNTDIEHNTKNDGKADYATYNMTTTSSDVSTANGKDPWGYLNTMVERANLIIEGIEEYGAWDDPEDADYALFRYYLGEALFLRSYVYLEMVKIWGDVPPRFESLAKNDAGMDIAMDDRNKIFDQLRIDLKRAAEYLPWSAECPGLMRNYTGRPSKAAALTLLARVDLTYAGYALRPDYIQVGGGAPYKVQLNTQDAALRTELYQEALESCAEIMKNGAEDSKLLDSFEQVFRNICADVEDYSQSEFIWEIPFAESRGQFMNYNTAKGDKSYEALKNNKSGSTNSSQAVVPTLLYDYEEGDMRRDVTILPYVWYSDNASSMASDSALREALMPGTAAADKRLYQKNQPISTFYLGKYRIEWMTRERASNDDGINYPVMRYADVILMFCEASLGGITGDVPTNNTGLDPQAQFDRIRERAGLDSKPLTMENLMDERKFEFCGEYIRKYDLERWGKLKEKLVETTKRLADLNAHTGEFEQTGDTIYFKYRLDNSFVYEGSGLNGYVMDSIWGLKKNEVGAPATFRKENGWVAKCIFSGDSGAELDPNEYVLYIDEELIDKRHYWPIFLVNVGSSNGTLWNDYDYQ